MSLLLLGLITEHPNRNTISQPLHKEVKQSNILYVYLIASSNVVLIKLGYIKPPSLCTSNCLNCLQSVHACLIDWIEDFYVYPCSIHLRYFDSVFPLHLIALSFILSLSSCFLPAWLYWELVSSLRSLITLLNKKGRRKEYSALPLGSSLHWLYLVHKH